MSTFLPTLLILAALQGGIEVNIGTQELVPEVPKLAPVTPNYNLLGSAEHEEQPKPFVMSAVGFAWRVDSITNEYVVRYVDPASDLYNKVFEGDLVISCDGQDPMTHANALKNFGDKDTVIKILIEHKGRRKLIPCKRKPLESFEPSFRAELMRGLRP